MADTNTKSRALKLPQIAVGAIIFHRDRILLVKRKYPPAKGFWALPGGRLQWGETIRQAAEREILEETGISIRSGKTVRIFELLPEQTESFHYIIINLEGEYLHGEPKAGDDAAAVCWFSREDLEKYELTPSTRKLLAETYNF